MHYDEHTMQPSGDLTAESYPEITRAQEILDDAWRELQRRPYVQARISETIPSLPDLSFEEARRRSKVGAGLLARLKLVQLETLPHELALSLRLVRFSAQAWAQEADWYWTVIDPLGVGLFGIFLPTAYCGGYLLQVLNRKLVLHRLTSSDDFERYLALVTDYARVVEQIADRTQGQAFRGIRMPKVQVEQARRLVSALQTSVRTVMRAPIERAAMPETEELVLEVENRIAMQIEPAFIALSEILSESYYAKAPETVGLNQYEGGSEIYQSLVRLHTTMDLTPNQVHRMGIDRLQEISVTMQAVRAELGFAGEAANVLSEIAHQPRWRAGSVDAISALFQEYIESFAPHWSAHFAAQPRARCRALALPESLEDSMTYGYYEPPSQGREEGVYHFNARTLKNAGLVKVAALTFHELIPGHHLQMCSQLENARLHPFRTYTLVNAYVEGWAEYAATLAGELGLYQEPEARYGRLLMDALLTSRVVVDTGMNAQGWSLDHATTFMQAHSDAPESEIRSECMRCSCDIPGQALGYKLGDTSLLEMRARMRQALGARFDIKEFHSAVLGAGGIPLTDLSWHIDHETKRLLQG